jgi:hypothetical protein
VYVTDAVVFGCAWEHQQNIWVDIGCLVTIRETPGSAHNKPGSILKHQLQAREYIKSQYRDLGYALSWLEMQLVCLEVIATTYH